MNVAKHDASALNNLSDRVWFQAVLKGEPVGYQTLISKTTGVNGRGTALLLYVACIDASVQVCTGSR